MESQAIQTQRQTYSRALGSLVRRLFGQWKYPVIVICGNPETGKTDAALLLAEIAKKEGVLHHFASNIQTYGQGERITSLEEADYWFKNQTGTKCYILDEAGVHDDSRNPLSLLNRNIRHEVFLVRKFKGHIIFILQDIADLDTWKSSDLTGAIIKKKVSDGHFSALIKTKLVEDLLSFDEWPKTSIPYDTLDIAPFTLERQISEEDVQLKGLPCQTAFLYAKTGNLSVIAKELGRQLGKDLKPMQAKRLLQAYLREQLHIEVKRGRPRKLVE